MYHARPGILYLEEVESVYAFFAVETLTEPSCARMCADFSITRVVAFLPISTLHALMLMGVHRALLYIGWNTKVGTPRLEHSEVYRHRDRRHP